MSRDREDRDRRPREPESLPRRPSREEIDEEIEHHLRGRAEELMAEGLDRAEAERRARRRFGSAARVRRRTERVYRRRRFLDPAALAGELAGALRSLRRRPAFSLTAVLLLVIGIGTASAMLAVLDAYLFRDLPFPHSDRLAWMSRVAPESGRDTPRPPALDWAELPEVELAVGWRRDLFTIVGGDRPEEVFGTWATPGFFRAFGVTPALGRTFTPEEVEGEESSVALIGHELWQSRFGGDPDILGRTLRVHATNRPDRATTRTIVGVLPADWWHLYESTQIVAPLPGLESPYVIRVAPGVRLQEAAARMTSHAREAWGPENDGWSIELQPLHEHHVQQVRPLLVAVGAGVGLVLLIACANVAVLLVVETSARARELAVRSALGAGRGRLALRQLLETGLLAAAGGAVGMLLAAQVLSALGPMVEARLGTSVPGGAVQLALTPRVVLMSVGVAAAVTLLSGLASLIVGTGRDPATAVSGGGSRATGSARQRGLRTGLIVVELAVSLALLVGAGLTLRSAVHLTGIDPGFDSRGLLRMGLSLSSSRYPEPEQWNARIDETLRKFRDVPGVQSATASLPSPFSFATRPVRPLDGPLADADQGARAAARWVAPGYFRTLGIELLRGRDFGAPDVADGEPVAIVSERLARRLWPGEGALGKSIRISHPLAEGEPAWRRVVGVVSDTREGLTGERDAPDAYVPLSQGPFRYVYLTVRSQQSPDSLVPTLQRLVREGDPEQPLSRPVLLHELVREASASTRALAGLLTVFACFGALLAVVGVYGVVAFAARQRRREIAVRMALGAAGRDVRRLVLRHGMRVVAAGLLVGLGGAWLMARALAGQIHGLSPTDPATFALLTAVLGCVALAGAAIPAARAAGTNPVDLLREE